MRSFLQPFNPLKCKMYFKPADENSDLYHIVQEVGNKFCHSNVKYDQIESGKF